MLELSEKIETLSKTDERFAGLTPAQQKIIILGEGDEEKMKLLSKVSCACEEEVKKAQEIYGTFWSTVGPGETELSYGELLELLGENPYE